MLKYHYSDNLLYKNIKTIYTIHNLRYQGVFPKSIIGDVIPFESDIFTEDKLKYYDCVSFMKGGINFADIVTTVSKTYASEITTKDYGEGLDGVLLEKGNKLYGIVNGIDTKNLNSKTDTNIYFNFDSNDYEIKYK
jgi:starch synthase